MAATLKEVVKRVLPRRRWDALRRLKRRSPYLSSPKAMRHLERLRARGFQPQVVLDVGAAHGDWTASCERIFPRASYLMVEPLPTYETELMGLATRKGIEYVPAAAGRAKGELPLFIPDDPAGSSFLPASREGDTTFKRSVTVPVTPLDDLTVPSGPILLKLDVQGYELEALAGAESLLARVEVLVAECSLYPFQREIPLVHEVIAYLVNRGFRFYDTADEFRWPSGTLAQVDLIFVSEGSNLRRPDDSAPGWRC